MLAVFVERGRADAVQLAARQHRLEQVAGVHRAVDLARADDQVQLVDEEDDPAVALLDLLEHGLEPLLEFAAVFRAGHERAHVERENRPVLQAFRHVAAQDALREALDDGRLAHAGLADEDGIVFRLARKDADRAADLLVAADDRIELALPRLRHEVDAVFFQRLIGGLGIVRRDALRSRGFPSASLKPSRGRGRSF